MATKAALTRMAPALEQIPVSHSFELDSANAVQWLSFQVAAQPATWETWIASPSLALPDAAPSAPDGLAVSDAGGLNLDDLADGQAGGATPAFELASTSAQIALYHTVNVRLEVN